MLKQRFFKGGAAVPHRKNTAECRTVKMGVPSVVVIPMSQHIGAPCQAVVKKGDEVKVGQVIGSSDKFVSSPVHSSVSGIVKDVSPRLYAGGIFIESVEIETDGKQEVHESVKPPAVSNRKEFLDAIRNSGLVGLGGAGFPTHVKLTLPEGVKVDTLVVNAAECEPYITSDYRELVENTEGFMAGLCKVLDMLEIGKAYIGIEDNKPEAIRLLTELSEKDSRIEVVTLASRYPQGAEKMLIYAITGRKVPPGKLPLDVGVVVMNVNSVSFVNEYLTTGMPLIRKRVTVDGSAVKNPGNVEVLIGTQLEDVFEFCGGFKSDPAKVIMGGPMMGIAQHSLKTPVLKNTNALLAFDAKDAETGEESACIRCGRCVDACPMNLMPLFLNLNVIKGDLEELAKYKPNDCIECGCCSYVCPAKRHLVQSIRLAKAKLRNAAAAKGGK